MAIKGYDEARREVAAIQHRLNGEVKTIRDNPTFTDQGRRVEMAKVTLRAQRDADAQRDQFIRSRNARRSSLQRSLFGINDGASPADVLVHRDSVTRAAALKSADEAQKLLDLSQRSGDASLSRAIAATAVSKGWSSVVDAYADGSSAYTQRQLNELAEIPSGSRTALVDQVAFAVRMPDELRDITGSEQNSTGLFAVDKQDHVQQLTQFVDNFAGETAKPDRRPGMAAF